MPRFSGNANTANYINYSTYTGATVYVSTIRRGARNVSVVLPSGDRMLVPRHAFESEWRVQTENERMNDLLSAQVTEIETPRVDVNFHNSYIAGMTFGIEFEFIGDERRREEFGRKMVSLLGLDERNNPRYVDEYNRYHTDNCDFSKWRLTYDSSTQHFTDVYSQRYGHFEEGTQHCHSRGYELVSPVLTFSNECFDEVRKVLNLINNVFRGYCNKYCGTHCHIGGFGANIHAGSQRQWHQTYFKRRVYEIGWAYGELEEQVFNKLVPESRHNAHYTATCNGLRGRYYSTESRYHHVNLMQFPCTGAVEFRQHSCTLNATKILSWAELVACFSKTAYNNPSCLQTARNSEDVFEAVLSAIQISEGTKENLRNRKNELASGSHRRRNLAQSAM